MVLRISNNSMFRPPAEADSLILQVDRGCPYNRCTFCGMYRGMRYQRLSREDVAALIAAEARYSDGVRRIFLADGDVMRRPYGDLAFMLAELARAFPALARVNVYATGSAIADKTPEQLRALRAGKLHTLYMGLESGDDEILRRVRKGESAGVMTEAVCRAQEAGLRASVMVLLGLGGRERTREHADGTAAVLNEMQPRLLSALRVVPVPDTELFEDVEAGRFQQLSEREVIVELRRLVGRLELSNTVFRANHSSNVIPIEARLPRDKDRLLCELDDLLEGGGLDSVTPGRQPLWL